MQCPVCNGRMVEKDFGITIDICDDGCKSIWFDHDELMKLDEPHEGVGTALQDALRHPHANDENRGTIKCPKCGIPMQIHRYKRSKEVNVDECYACGGFFLDSGELKEIRDTYMTDDECAYYQEKLLSEIPEYEERMEDAKRDRNREKATLSLTELFKKRYWGFPF